MVMAFPTITALYTALMTLMLLGFTYYVILGRWKYKSGLGNGRNEDLMRRIRIHGNFVEFVPFLLFIMLLLEMRGMQTPYLHAYGIIMIIARALHAWGLYTSSGTSKGRMAGVLLTHLLLAFGILNCLISYFAFDV